MAGRQKFTKLDLPDAYNQLTLDEASQQCLATNTHSDLYKYRRLPVGISSAPALFQKVMNKVLAGLKGVAFFMDDIPITGVNDKDHVENLTAVLQQLRQYSLWVKKQKCVFLQSS